MRGLFPYLSTHLIDQDIGAKLVSEGPGAQMKDTALRQLARWACGLQLEHIPERVRLQGVNQILSTLAAVYAGWDSDLGRPVERALSVDSHGCYRIIPTGKTASATQAAMLMTAWSMVLDFDDVMLGGHTGHSSVLVPIALGSAGGRSGADLLVAQIVANELAARINMVCAVGPTRGQMATHLHLVAAASAKAKLEKLDDESFTEVLAFALSYPSRALYPAFLGSDAKALCAALPTRVGMEAIDAVQAGLRPGADPLDGPHGFFATQSSVSVREFLGGPGERWHTETNSFKIYPVCGYLCGALDATLNLVDQYNVSGGEIVSVDVWASAFTVAMDAHSSTYLDGPRSKISTLTFSTPFVIASAILAREFGPTQLKRKWIEDPRVWELASRVRSRHDVRLTLEAITADIPIGAALRRVRRRQAAAFGWKIAGTVFGRYGRWRHPATFRLVVGLAQAAGDHRPFDFQNCTKRLGALVDIGLKDGRHLRQAVSIPRGFAGAPISEAGGKTQRDLMREKFIAAAGHVIGIQRATAAADMIEAFETLSATDIARLLDLMNQSITNQAAKVMS